MGKKSLVWLLLGGVAITAAWGLINRTGSDTSAVDKYASVTTPPIATAAPTAPAMPDPAPATAPSAATIINVDEKPSSPAISNGNDGHHDPLANLLEAGSQVPGNRISAALSSAQADAPAKPHVAVQPTQRAEPVKVAAEHSKPVPPTPSKSIDPIDNDVSLISALVAHTEAEPQPPQASTQSHPKRAAKKTTQDIVERRTGDSTTALIKRCKRLGGTEAKLCQRRICVSHETEAACKAK